MNDISLPLDERNLAHVFTALALAGIADSLKSKHSDSHCYWAEDGFKVRIPETTTELFIEAHDFAKSIEWVEGIGSNEEGEVKASPHHGLFTAKGRRYGNPLLSYYDQGITSSIFKTFSAQQRPATLLERQQHALKEPMDVADWLLQSSSGVASWKFDCQVASHAYDQGFGSNEDQSGDQDPFYPAIELLGIAGAAFFTIPQAWLLEAESLAYCVWHNPVSLNLASLAANIVPSPTRKHDKAKMSSSSTYQPASLLVGIGSRYYQLATRGNTYGKGAAYRHFPEATPINPTQKH